MYVANFGIFIIAKGVLLDSVNPPDHSVDWKNIILINESGHANVSNFLLVK